MHHLTLQDQDHPAAVRSIAALNCVAKVKALDPVMSTSAPSLAKVIEYDELNAKVRSGRYLPTGTLIQLHLEGEFSLWTVRKCAPDGASFFLNLELTELVSTH